MSNSVGSIGRLQYLVALSILLLAVTGQTQHDHGGKGSSSFDRFETPQVTYRVDAKVEPRQGMISGWMDISYTNLSSDSLRSICLDFSNCPYDDTLQFDFHDTAYQGSLRESLTQGKGRFIWLDSALYQVAPLGGFARMNGRKMIELPLPSPLSPGESGPLIVAFKTRFRPVNDSLKGNDCWEIITDWFPPVAHYYDGEWHPVADMETTNDHPMATYEVSLAIDSAFHLIAPGELVNQKEHYGTLPRPTGDTVAVDVTSFLYAFVPEHPYRPKFEGGVKKYFYRLLDGNDFDLLLTNRIQIDLADAEGVPIQVVYPEIVAPVYRERVAEQARKVTIGMKEKFGDYPFPALTIVTMAAGGKSPGSRAMLGLNQQAAGNSDIYGALVKLISRSWLVDFLPTKEAVAALPYFSTLDEALAAIASEDLMSVRMSDNTIGPAEMAADNVEGWSLATPYVIERAKGDLNEKSVRFGREKFREFMRRLASEHRFRPVAYSEYQALLRDCFGEEIKGQPKENSR